MKAKGERITTSTPMYSFGVVGFFPEAIAHLAHQAVTVDAPTIADAARAGVLKLRERDGLKGKHFKTVRLTISYMGTSADKRGQLGLDTDSEG